ncbi:hypothetical protein SALB_04840 [Streptomyces noursei]|uniref:Uncharacterized protein n=1 Tax=Streptomyces noursei TaxID=1971 RepID=A0A401R356_STRNR|nr:hypothetical protein SALB_04840 [Streptomyces noursei]
MERGVAAAASERAQGVDYGLRIVAQEQVGLAYAGWDRLLTRVALPAWRMGRWPSRLDAGVVSALTELSRRDRLAQGFASRLGERPACDLLEEPGTIDRAASLLAARLFHGGPAEPGPNWSPVAWQQYPEEIVDRKWRLEAARLHRVLDELPAAGPADPDRTPADPPATTTAPPLTYAGARARTPAASHGEGLPRASTPPPRPGLPLRSRRSEAPAPAGTPVRASRRAPPRPPPRAAPGPTLARVIDRLARDPGSGDLLAARLGAEVAREEREEAARQATRSGRDGTADPGRGDDPADDGLPLFPLQPPRTARELLADHVTAMVCCAAVDTAGAAPGLDWLDGPALLVDGARRADLGRPVLSLVDDGDAEPLRGWLHRIGVRPEKPVRLA